MSYNEIREVELNDQVIPIGHPGLSIYQPDTGYSDEIKFNIEWGTEDQTACAGNVVVYMIDNSTPTCSGGQITIPIAGITPGKTYYEIPSSIKVISCKAQGIIESGKTKAVNFTIRMSSEVTYYVVAFGTNVKVTPYSAGGSVIYTLLRPAPAPTLVDGVDYGNADTFSKISAGTKGRIFYVEVPSATS